MNRTHPQRLATGAPYGSLLKRLFALAPRLRSVETNNDPIYLALIRQLPCLHCMLEPCDQAAHIRRQSGIHNKRDGIGKKPADRWTVPLCQEHHMLQHRVGELQFWHDLGIDPLLICRQLYEKRGDLVAMRAVIFNAIAERR